MKRQCLVFIVCLVLLASALTAGHFIPSCPAVEISGIEGEYVFVLDAGHGGEDGGAVSAAGNKESEINLSIVLRLEQLMAFCGMKTVLTRSEDISIHDPGAVTLREKKVSDLRNRVALINNTGNGILLSIHQNSFSDSRYSGAQVFYTSDEWSRLWGESAQEILKKAINPNNNRAAKPVPDSVYLMNHVTRPGILVECGFLSNGEEAALLLTATYQKQIALALAGMCCAAELIEITA